LVSWWFKRIRTRGDIMASVYKQKKYRPIPENAEIIRRRGHKIARWDDRRGTRREAPLSEDGSQVIIESGPYWGKYRDHNSVVKRRSTGCRDKQSAEKKLQDWLTEADRVDSGLVTTEELNARQRAKRPIDEHLEAYIAFLRHKTTRGRRTNPVHVANVKSQIKQIITDRRFAQIVNISRSAVEKWMHQEENRGESSGKTINNYRSAIMAFCRWAVSEQRLISNPLEGLYTADETDKKRLRRALTEAEIAKLLAVARSRPLAEARTIRSGPRKGQLRATVRPDVERRLIKLGVERALMYQSMIHTGLRKGELASLTVSDLHLDADPPFLSMQALNAKNARADEIPLRADFVGVLREWTSNKLPNAKLFRVPNGLRKILYRDLALAGVQQIDKSGRPIADAHGRKVDVHALRHTAGTQLAKHGVLPQVASRIMRHSSINMTMKHYTHLALEDKSKAVERLPAYDSDLGAESEKKTGTDDTDVTPSEKYAQKYAQQQSLRDNECQDKCDLGDNKESSPSSQSVVFPQKTNASERTRTSTGYCPLGPKPSASANSATLAFC
jgi:integrase